MDQKWLRTWLKALEVLGELKGALTSPQDLPETSQRTGRLPWEPGYVPLRKRILELLDESPFTARQLTEKLGASRNTIKKLLSELRQQGLVKRRGWWWYSPHLLEKNRPAGVSGAADEKEVRDG